MSSPLLQIVFGAVLVGLVAVSSVHGFKDPQPYFDLAESESQEYGQTVVGEDNRLPCPYAVHGVRPPQGECQDCGFVIVEKRHHYCIPGKSVIKVLRRKPSCNCKSQSTQHGNMATGYYASESQVVPNYEMPSSVAPGPSPVAMSNGSDQVTRMLRTLMKDQHRGGSYGEAVEKPVTPQYRTLDSSNGQRSYN
uniref:Uncharacterized protein n=1 Tax=Anopheles epiroticus TaxID=199890 RepID=A0A182PRY5_9DIPT